MLMHDDHIQKWVYGIIHGEPEPSGDFLGHLAQAVVRADPENYAALRPAVVLIMAKYPKYRCQCAAT